MNRLSGWPYDRGGIIDHITEFKLRGEYTMLNNKINEFLQMESLTLEESACEIAMNYSELSKMADGKDILAVQI